MFYNISYKDFLYFKYILLFHNKHYKQISSTKILG